MTSIPNREHQAFVPVAGRMTTEGLGKGCMEMILRPGFAEALPVREAFEAYRDCCAVDLSRTSFFVGDENPVPTTRPDLSLWREKLYVVLARNAFSAAACFQIPPKRVVKLGMQVEL